MQKIEITTAVKEKLVETSTDVVNTESSTQSTLIHATTTTNKTTATLPAKEVKTSKKWKSGKHEKMKRRFSLKLKPINFVFLTLAGIINAVGVGLILVPNSLIDGGFSGTSFLLYNFTNLPISVFLVLLNVPIFLFALKKLGYKTLIYSIYAIIVYSLSVYVLVDILHLNGLENNNSIITTDLVLAAIFGGLVSGVGSGITIRFHGALDGVEVLGIMFAKKLSMTIGQFVMVYNCVIFIIAGFILGFSYPLYSILAYFVGIKAVDGIVEGLDKSKMAIIITSKGEEVGKAISDRMKRGITVLNAQGFYSKEQKAMLYVVVNRFEISRLKAIVSAVDGGAFVSISEVSEVLASSKTKAK